MNRTALILPVFVLTLVLGWSCQKPLSTGATSSKKTASRGIQEFHQRNGLPNFFQKIKEGREINVAYIGGSITEAGDGWRSLTFNWLRINYPHNSFNEINATIGGTGSNLGVFRIDRDVLVHKPDLVFVEFAVNDSGRSPHQIEQSMEGIVRKIWEANPATDICFVYTLSANQLKDLQEGRYQVTAQTMEEIADRYQIPSINMGVEVARLATEGKLIFTGKPEENPGKIVFTTDRTHPLSKSGHPIYASVVRKYLEEMERLSGAKPHVLSTPLAADNWETAQLITLSELPPSVHWQKLPADHELVKSFSKFMPAIYKATSPDALLRVRFKGTTLGFYDIVGPGSGILEVTLDGEKREVQRFDQYCHYYRKFSFYLDGLSDTDHEVTVRVTGRAFDKAAILQKRNIKIDDPSRYAENGWYLSNLLLVGKLESLHWD
ncbi:SGNH/GDSL hydrolase family protein [Spirosoma endbachense]|uniref:SGNH/GDSL hydrolase family protein n=1 Tax=Spirosoma endbachense TaxID=2666025 RepID=A0A6P1W3U0_9BACT|nr:SGNH/GDSL hydrolase family protein [Spirosoma endbachense]QHW00112.1 SGNH/GDSL hydrolase family protein [Spirosoma endbachense]